MFRCPILFLGYIQPLVVYKNIKMVPDNYKLKKYWAKLFQFSRGAPAAHFLLLAITIQPYGGFV